MSAGTAEICELLTWDSEFFDLRVARVLSDRLTPAAAADVDGWCAENRVDCLYFLCSPEEGAWSRCAGDDGYRLVDVRVVLTKPLSEKEPGIESFVTRVTEEDVSALAELAATSHRASRFYQDGRFPEKDCDRLYRTWIEKSCRGYADAVFVPRREGAAAGYLTCKRADSDRGKIGLLAVDGQSRGRGFGRALVRAAESWGVQHGLASMEVTTQGRNEAALRLYQRCGFSVAHMKLWFHKWFTPRSGDGTNAAV